MVRHTPFFDLICPGAQCEPSIVTDALREKRGTRANSSKRSMKRGREPFSFKALKKARVPFFSGDISPGRSGTGLTEGNQRVQKLADPVGARALERLGKLF